MDQMGVQMVNAAMRASCVMRADSSKRRLFLLNLKKACDQDGSGSGFLSTLPRWLVFTWAVKASLAQMRSLPW